MGNIATNSGFTNKLSAFVGMAEGTSLFLIRQIDQTVDALTADTKAAAAVTAASNVLVAELNKRSPKTNVYLDPEDQIIDGLKRAYESIEALLPKMLVRKSSIDNDNRLNEDHCDLLHTAYDEAINSFAEMVESMKNLTGAVIRHDLAAEPRECEEFDSVGDLIKSLRSAA